MSSDFSKNGSSLYFQTKNLFIATVDLPPDERVQLLDAQCADDAALREAVEALLACHDRSRRATVSAVPGRALPSERLGPYLLLESMNRGGTATIYRARHEGGGPDVALKVFNPGFGSGEARRRFEQEAAILARLDHPGIVRLVDHGTLPLDQGPVPFVATEFVPGATLLEWVAGRQPERSERVRLLQSIAATVGHAHEAGVTHRDLKPNNIIVRPDGSPCVLDFGIARLREGDDPATDQFTVVGQLLGTMRYMSPEQARGDTVGPATDVHALGLIVCEVLTGDLPYEVPGETLTRAVASIAGAEPRMLSQLDPDLAGPLDAVVHQALARRPDKRYPAAGALAADLQRVLDGRPVAARAPGLGDRLGRTRRRWLVTGLVTVAAAALLLTAGRLLIDRPPPGPRAAGVYALLDSADQRIHLEERTESGLREALATLDRARALLSAAPPSIERTTLLRYAHWRRGEAHYFLGGMLDSSREYFLANQEYGLAYQYEFRPDAGRYLLADHAVTNRALDVSRHHPPSGKALAHAAVADFGDDVSELTLAVFDSRASLYEATRPDSVAFRRDFNPITRDLYRAMAHADLGRYLTLLAAATDSLPLLDEAIALFATADDPYYWRFNRAAFGVAQEFAGRAYLQRANLESGAAAAADADSAAVHLDRALTIRTEARFPRGRVVTLGTCAQLELWRGRTAADPATARAHFTRGVERIAAALALLAGLDPVPRYAARLHLTGAELEAALGDREAARRHLEQAVAEADTGPWPREAARAQELAAQLDVRP